MSLTAIQKNILIDSTLECFNYSKEAIEVYTNGKDSNVVIAFINLANQSLKIGQSFYLENFKSNGIYEYEQFYKHLCHFFGTTLKNIASIKTPVTPETEFKNLQEIYNDLEKYFRNN